MRISPQVESSAYAGFEILPVVMGSTSISIPADGVFDIPQVPEITISLPWIGTILTRLGMGALVVGALNLTSPRVQQENFELIKEKPVEVGSMTIWMKDNGGNQAQGSFPNGINNFFKTLFGGGPQPAPAQQPPQPEKPEPPQKNGPAPKNEDKSDPPKDPLNKTDLTIGEKEELLTLNNYRGAPVLIPTNPRKLDEIFKREGALFKFVVVRRVDQEIECRLNPGAKGAHDYMVLEGETVIGAGELQLKSDGRLIVLGNSTAYPTSKDGIEHAYDATHKIDPEAGLEKTVEIIREFLPESEIVKNEHYTGYGDMYMLQIHF